MTDAPPAAGLTIDGDSWGVAWHLELAGSLLIPGTLVDGLVRIRSAKPVAARALVVGLVGVEHWRHREQRTDAQGHTTTEVMRSTAEPIREPVTVVAPVTVGSGEVLERRFQLPVPPIGPASLDAEDAGMTWTVEAKLDVEGGFDSRVEAPVIVAQPTALLRAGAVQLGELALYDEAEAAADGVTASLRLAPMPLVCGEPFTATLELHTPGPARLQEIRAELRVQVEATVSQGEHESITAWQRSVAPEGEISGSRTVEIQGRLPARPLPSIELAHGRTSATFHVILARAWAIDTHLVRDVAIATTREV